MQNLVNRISTLRSTIYHLHVPSKPIYALLAAFSSCSLRSKLYNLRSTIHHLPSNRIYALLSSFYQLLSSMYYL